MQEGTTGNYLAYTIKNGENPILNNVAVLTVAAADAYGGPNNSVDLTFVAENPTIAGNYTDTLTFTVSVDE